MTEIFNRNAEKEKRRALRSRMTEAERQLWEKIRNKQVGVLRFTNEEVLVERDKVVALIQDSVTPTRAARLPLR